MIKLLVIMPRVCNINTNDHSVSQLPVTAAAEVNPKHLLCNTPSCYLPLINVHFDDKQFVEHCKNEQTHELSACEESLATSNDHLRMTDSSMHEVVISNGKNEDYRNGVEDLPDDSHCHDDSFELVKREENRKAIKKLFFGFTLCFAFMLVELVGGYLSHSLAIFTDAAHLSSDLVGFAISLLTIYMGQKKATGAKSFGYYRIEVIGAFFSVFIILIMTVILIYFAIERIIYQDFHLESTTMLIVSSIGLGINFVMMAALSDGFGMCKKRDNHARTESTMDIVQHSSHGHSHVNMNVRAAMLHLVGDIIQSLGVLIAAIIIHFWPQLKLADPICTLIFGLLVFLTTLPIIRDIVHILMEGFPRELEYHHIRQLLLDNIAEVVHVHSLHVWSLTHGRNVMSVHLAIDAGRISSADQFESIRKRAEKLIRRELHIHQTTIQVEYHQASLIDRCQSCIGPSL